MTGLWPRHAVAARPLVMDLDGAGERVPVDVCSCGAARKVGRWFWSSAGLARGGAITEVYR